MFQFGRFLYLRHFAPRSVIRSHLILPLHIGPSLITIEYCLSLDSLPRYPLNASLSCSFLLRLFPYWPLVMRWYALAWLWSRHISSLVSFSLVISKVHAALLVAKITFTKGLLEVLVALKQKALFSVIFPWILSIRL